MQAIIMMLPVFFLLYILWRWVEIGNRQLEKERKDGRRDNQIYSGGRCIGLTLSNQNERKDKPMRKEIEGIGNALESHETFLERYCSKELYKTLTEVVEFIKCQAKKGGAE